MKNVQQKAKKMPKSSVPVQAVVETNDIYHVHEYIAANYMNKWYISQIKDADSKDNTVEVSFLETKKAIFQWPTRHDVIWVDISSVLCNVSDSNPSGKSKCMLVMNLNDIKMIKEIFGKL